jgi:hypothetical protein
VAVAGVIGILVLVVQAVLVGVVQAVALGQQL